MQIRLKGCRSMSNFLKLGKETEKRRNEDVEQKDFSFDVKLMRWTEEDEKGRRACHVYSVRRIASICLLLPPPALLQVASTP